MTLPVSFINSQSHEEAQMWCEAHTNQYE